MKDNLLDHMCSTSNEEVYPMLKVVIKICAVL